MKQEDKFEGVKIIDEKLKEVKNMLGALLSKRSEGGCGKNRIRKSPNLEEFMVSMTPLITFMDDAFVKEFKELVRSISFFMSSKVEGTTSEVVQLKLYAFYVTLLNKCIDLRFVENIETLLYYDGVLVFIGKDHWGKMYLCLLTFDESIKEERYLAVQVSDEEIEKVKNDEIDVYSVFANQPEEGFFGSPYYMLDVFDDKLLIAYQCPKGFRPSEDMLPSE